MRRRLLALASLLIGIAAVLPARAGSVPERSSGTVPVLVIDGKGWGHGVGMAQDGAYWMARSGSDLGAIMGHFYPGTSFGHSSGTIRVAVFTTPARDTVLTFPNGGDVRDAPSGQQSPGFPVTVGPGGTVHIWFDGARYHAQAGGTPPPAGHASASAKSVRLDRVQLASANQPLAVTTTTIPAPGPPPPPPQPSTTTTTPKAPAPPGPQPTQPPPSPPPPQSPPPSDSSSVRTLWGVPANGGVVGVPARSRQYRGVIEATASGGPLRLVNQVDVEQYLRGMGEVRDESWPQSALKAQAVAARTYALRAMAFSGEICDDDHCQVYLGQQAEYAAMDRAVADTRGLVMMFGGGLASTVYSANAGGFSATPQEGFGADNGLTPYLRAAPYTTQDPMPWTVRVALPDLASRFQYAAALTGAHISKAGPSGRALEVTLDGANGPAIVDGRRFAAGLGLKSNLFAFRVEQADVAPPPPPPGDVIQAPPGPALPATTDAGPAVSVANAAPPVRVRSHKADVQGRWPWIALAVLLLVGWGHGASHAERTGVTRLPRPRSRLRLVLPPPFAVPVAENVGEYALAPAPRPVADGVAVHAFAPPPVAINTATYALDPPPVAADVAVHAFAPPPVADGVSEYALADD